MNGRGFNRDLDPAWRESRRGGLNRWHGYALGGLGQAGWCFLIRFLVPLVGLVASMGLAMPGMAAGQTTGRQQLLDRYQLNPLPGPLARLRGVHPRLFLDAQGVRKLRREIAATHAALWKAVRQQADSIARRGPPKYRLRDKYSGDEQLWQRGVGNAMPLLAMAYLMTGQRRYLDAARAWALASCSHPTWGLGRIDGMDLAAGHQLFGLAIVYDWCYAGLGDSARRTIRNTLLKRGEAMFEAAATGKAWWRRSYLQNHLWVDACGLSTAGLAVFDKAPEATRWIGLGLDKFKLTMAALGDDGASQEGIGYWEYGTEYLLKFMWLGREMLGVSLFNHPWWRKTALYPLYLSIPRHAWTRRDSIVDIADCPRYHWYGPDYQLRCLAREYHEGHAQWLAQEIDRAGIDAPAARWLNLIWYDPAIRPEPPADLPTLYHFTDLDIVSARSGWSGDESLVVFKCGPFIGHTGVKEFSYDPGGGHVHPDANHFVVFGDGQWLIRDDGYSSKWTGQHNTLLIDGKGQTGEGHEWFRGSVPLAVKAEPRILRAVSTPQLDQMSGDATEAYPRSAGLRHYIRHLLFLKPNVLLVLDDIQMDHRHSLELRFHPEQQGAAKEGSAYLCRGKRADLRVEPLTVEGVKIRNQEMAGQDRHGGSSLHLFTIRLQTDQSHWRNAVALSWTKAGEPPPKVRMKATSGVWTFRTGRERIDFDWDSSAATLRVEKK